MDTIIGGVVLDTIGLALTIFRGWFTRRVIDSQNETFGFYFGEKRTKYTEWITSLAGVILATLRVQVVLGKFRLQG